MCKFLLGELVNFVSSETKRIVFYSPSYSENSLEEFGFLSFVYGDGSMFFWYCLQNSVKRSDPLRQIEASLL